MTAPALVGVQLAPAEQLRAALAPGIQALRRWTGWRARPKTLADGTTKTDKVPKARINDPTTWLELDQALAEAPPPGEGGIGYVLTSAPGVPDAGVWAVDVDKCRDPETGDLSPVGRTIYDAAAGCYTEISPSGRGLRILGAGGVPDTLREYLNQPAGVEFYKGTSGRYVTITGAVLQGAGALEPMPPALAELLAKHTTKETQDKPGTVPAAAPVMGEGARVSVENRAGLTNDQREFARSGGPPGDRSESLWGILRALSEAGLLPGEIFSFAVSSPGIWRAALSKRNHSPHKARQFLWSEAHRAARNEDPAAAAPPPLPAADTTTEATTTTTTAGGDDGYEYGGHGRARAVKKIASNVAAYVRKEWGHRVRYNERHGRLEVDGQPFQLQGRLRNDLIRSMCRRFGWDTEPSLEILTQGLIEAAEADTFDPVVEYLDGLKWDGRDRIREFMAALGAAPSALTLAILLKTLIAAVARARRPGCKAEVVTIFVGPQGARKSMAWRVLGSAPERNPDPSAPSDTFSDASVEFSGDKDSQLKSVSPWIHELAELATKKSADRDQVKAALSQQTEVFRPPYGREVQSRPRRGIRVGSTNETQFLNDPTGARRWWPVEVGQIDIPWLMANRDQLWAQADAAFKAGIAWWFEPGEHAEELSERHEAAYDADSLELLLAERLTPDLAERWRAEGAVLIGEVALTVGIDLARAPRNVANRLGDALRRLGYRRTQVRRGSQRVKAWKHRSWDCVTPPASEVDPLG